MQSLLFLRENPRKKDLKRDLSSTSLINPPSGKEEEREEVGSPEKTLLFTGYFLLSSPYILIKSTFFLFFLLISVYFRDKKPVMIKWLVRGRRGKEKEILILSYEVSLNQIKSCPVGSERKRKKKKKWEGKGERASKKGEKERVREFAFSRMARFAPWHLIKWQ